MWFKANTKDIEVWVRPLYRHKDSRPRENLYVWSYDVHIENRSQQTIQLLHRHWQITDAEGKLQRVSGPGVVGEQPVIPAGEHYEYSSFTHLPNESGEMAGKYEILTMDDETFMIDIPKFSLRLPVRLVEPPAPPLQQTALT